MSKAKTTAAPKKAAVKKAKVEKAVDTRVPHTPETEQQQSVFDALTPVEQLNGKRLVLYAELTKRSDIFKDLLPARIPVQKFVQTFVMYCVNNTNLLLCSISSLITCATRCAQLGLVPDNYLGEAHLIPFNNPNKNNMLEAQFVPGYRGLIQLAIRTGQVKRFQARAVHENDFFDYSFGTEEYIKHKPKGESANITFVYAVIEFTNGGLMFDVMTRAEVDQVKESTPAWKETPAKQRVNLVWEKNFSDMSKKTVIRRLSKYAPVSQEFQLAVSLDEKLEIMGESQIEASDLDWEQMTEKEQLEAMQELLKKDKAKKDLLFAKDLSKTNRSEDLMKATEELILKA